jgi:hypothetical protein
MIENMPKRAKNVVSMISYGKGVTSKKGIGGGWKRVLDYTYHYILNTHSPPLTAPFPKILPTTKLLLNNIRYTE